MLNRSITFVTLHKAASTFIANDLGRQLQKSEGYDECRAIGALQLKGVGLSQMSDWSPTGLVCVRAYPAGVQGLLGENVEFTHFVKDSSIVFVERDPRDVAVSLYYSKAFSHTTKVLDKKQFLKDRESLQEMTALEGVRKMTSKGAIREFKHLHQLHSELGGIMMRYEDLVLNPTKWLSTVGAYVGWSSELVGQLTDKFEASFAPPSKDDPYNHKRRITPGNWIEVFDKDLRSVFDKEIGDLMRSNGYE